ncbi:MAG: SRPBCC family protein [Bacteroidota bacterium]
MKSFLKISFLFSLSLLGLQLLQAQEKVQKFTVSHVIQAPADKVWAVVGEDYGAIANSHPKIISSDYINGSLQAGEGAQRVCNFNESGTKFLKEKMVDYDPVNYTFRNQVFQAGKFPVDPQYTYAIYRVEPIDENSCRFTFDMTYRTTPAMMGAMMKGNFKKLIADYAVAVEHHVNTGESVNKDNFKEVKRQYTSR